MIILCEGKEDGIDRILLEKILGDSGRILPVGSRFGMKHRIEALRMVCHEPVLAVLDRDFPETWEARHDVPVPWKVNDQSSEQLLGWFWERKEIENYLLEPVVIRQALGATTFDWSRYQTALESARDTIGIYQAARIALSVLGRTGQYYVPSTFGSEHGSGDRYRFPDQNDLDEDRCRKWLRQVDEEYKDRHSSRFQRLHQYFEFYRDECSPGGARHHDFMAAFSGKDLAWQLSSWFQGNGFQGTKHFFACMKEGVRKQPNAPTDWIPEWRKLRQCINDSNKDEPFNNRGV